MGIRFFGVSRTDEKHIDTNTYVDALGEADAIPEREVLFRGDPIARSWGAASAGDSRPSIRYLPLQDHRLRRRCSADDRQILVEPEFERTDRRVGLEVRLVLAPTVFIGEIRPSHRIASPRKSEGHRPAAHIAAM